MQRVKIVAGVVAFNPDLELLRENLTAVASQVDAVVVIDNASAAGDAIEALCSELRVRVVRNDGNRGVSGALNQAMRWSAEHGAGRVLVLDQDSVAAPGMVAMLAEHCDDTVAMTVPRYVDRNLVKVIDPPGDPTVRNVAHWITSGSLVRIAAWEQVGGYDEALFVDFVDFDFCTRLGMAGLPIRVVPHAILMHEVGQSEMRGRVMTYNHSAFRNALLARDMVVYARKHRGHPGLVGVPQGVALTCLVLLRRMAVVARYEDDKAAKIRALGRGMIRGLATPLGAPRSAVGVLGSPRSVDRSPG